MTKTALYRHFGKDGNLLYVGISANPQSRLASHRASSDWFSEIYRIDVEWHENRELALEAEKRAIHEGQPGLNKNHSTGVKAFQEFIGPRKPVSLQEFFAVYKVKANALAQAVGISPSYLSDIKKGNRVPSLRVAFAIEDATQGAVPARSWVGEPDG